MSRPPIINVSSGRSLQGDSVTPRTPHSARRHDDGYTDIELDDLGSGSERSSVEYSPGLSQQSPLLPGSNTSTRGNERWRIDRYVWEAYEEWKNDINLAMILSRVPILVGSFVTGFVIYLIMTLDDVDDPSGFGFNSSRAMHASYLHPQLIISYPNYTEYPLTSAQYVQQCDLEAQRVKDMGGRHLSYWAAHSFGVNDVLHSDEDEWGRIRPHRILHTEPICRRTVTYMLDGEVGLLADISLLVQAAALAQERNRTFFIDDSKWTRGKWTDYFQDITLRLPGPEPGCRPPPPQELVACPRLARHWVISARTARFHFGEAFRDHYEDGYAHNLNRARPIFKAAFSSLSYALRPNPHVSKLIRSARNELLQILSSSVEKGPSIDPGLFYPQYIGVHVRRGDKHPSSSRYRTSYIPILDYVGAAKSSWTRLRKDDGHDLQKFPAVYLASDAPSALEEFKKEYGSSDLKIFSLSLSTDPNLAALASPKEYVQKDFNEWTLGRRVNATKGMLVDFALLSGAWSWEGDLIPDAVVCTVSSAICKLAAVGFGWSRAFGEVDEGGVMDAKTKGWVDVDEKGLVIPPWTAFNLFY